MGKVSPRANAIIDSFASVILPHSRIIDIGAGKGLLAQEMVQRFNARVTMVDVASYNQTPLPLTVCDSRRLAFADSSFDYALLSFVLHHSRNPEMILREALRVAREVIVIENDVCGKLRGAVTRLIDSWPSIQYGTPPCYFTKTHDEWMRLFVSLGVEAQAISKFSLELGFFRNFTARLQRRNKA
jgi:ubiquinone/menaquinone biosynthesis C-methylase UbiE